MTLLVGSIFHMTRKIVSEMTYNVSMGTLNPTIPYHTIPLLRNYIFLFSERFTCILDDFCIWSLSLYIVLMLINQLACLLACCNTNNTDAWIYRRLSSVRVDDSLHLPTTAARFCETVACVVFVVCFSCVTAFTCYCAIKESFFLYLLTSVAIMYV